MSHPIGEGFTIHLIAPAGGVKPWQSVVVGDLSGVSGSKADEGESFALKVAGEFAVSMDIAEFPLLEGTLVYADGEGGYVVDAVLAANPTSVLGFVTRTYDEDVGEDGTYDILLAPQKLLSGGGGGGPVDAPTMAQFNAQKVRTDKNEADILDLETNYGVLDNRVQGLDDARTILFDQDEALDARIDAIQPMLQQLEDAVTARFDIDEGRIYDLENKPLIKIMKGDLLYVSQESNPDVYAPTVPEADFPDQILFGADTGIFYKWAERTFSYYPAPDYQETFAKVMSWLPLTSDFEVEDVSLATYDPIIRGAGDATPIAFQFGPQSSQQDAVFDPAYPQYIVFQTQKTWELFASFTVTSGGNAQDYMEIVYETAPVGTPMNSPDWARQTYYSEKMFARLQRIGDRMAGYMGSFRPRRIISQDPITAVRISVVYRSTAAAQLSYTAFNFTRVPAWRGNA